MLRSKFRVEKCDKTLSKHNPDFLLDNFVEAEVKSVLWPLYVAQCLSLAPKYSMRYGLITSISCYFYVFVCVCAVAISAAWFCSLFGVTSGILYSTALYAYGITLIIVYINNSTVTTYKSNMNAYLIILIQKIHIDFEYVKLNTRNISIVSWIFLIAIIFFNAVHFILRVVEVPHSVSRIFLVHLIYISNDCNLIIKFRTIHLLGKYIETWILELEHFCSTNFLDDTERDYIKNTESRMKKIITGYDKIVEALDICNKIFGVSILFSVVMSFFQVFFNVQYIILVSILHTVPSWKRTMYISQTLWIKNITLMSILCMESENVCLRMKNAEVACTVLSATHTSADLCRVLRRQEPRAGVSWLRAVGFFPVDATLPPRFLAVLATYTVVILQFYFL
nr:gustatory receptor 45 [Papilio xuthus]